VLREHGVAQAARIVELLVAIEDREAVIHHEFSDRLHSLSGRGFRKGGRRLHDRRRGCENLLPVA
jgi:hypothetical protein